MRHEIGGRPHRATEANRGSAMAVPSNNAQYIAEGTTPRAPVGNHATTQANLVSGTNVPRAAPRATRHT
eukprot:10164167-Lingulodinium_polyedra.AAC.1